MNVTDQIVEFFENLPDNSTASENSTELYSDNGTLVIGNSPDWLSISELYFYHVLTILIFIGFPINIFHFVILTRKELRSSVVYRIMIGISLCDFCTHICTFLTWSPYFIRSSPTDEEMCYSTQTYFDVMMDYIAVPILDVTQRTSSWLTVFMALFRTLSVMFPMSSRMQNLAKPEVALLAFIVALSLATGSGLPVFLPIQVFVNTTEETCDGVEFELREPRYSRLVPHEIRPFHRLMVSIYGLFKAAPALFDLILAILLILELVKARKRRNKLTKTDDEQFDSTTKLIIFMTFSFFLLEVPNGIGHIAFGLFFPTGTARRVLQGVLEYAEIFPVINCASHVFVCFFMTAQYRGAVKTLLRVPDDSKVFSIVAKTSSASNS